MNQASFDARVFKMQNLHLERQDWQTVLDLISKVESTHKVTIEVDREDIGSQKEVENAELQGLSYDHKGGSIAIRAGAVEHMIVKPERIDAAHAGADLIAIEVSERDKTRHLITFAPPLHLPQILMPVLR